jgi:hypothetical protein
VTIQSGYVRARCWGRDCHEWIIRKADPELLKDKLCEQCRGRISDPGYGTPYPATPPSDRNYHGGQFNTGEW